MKIAIDGPGGAGKSTVARVLASRIGAAYIDTGAMYRAMALAVARKGGRSENEKSAAEAVAESTVTITRDASTGEQRVLLDGEDVSGLIRTPEMSSGASAVSKHACVRERLMALQRELAEGSDVVMDGRDIGTVVFPDADYKFFLTAKAEIRAKRRYDELLAKGAETRYEDCLRDLIERDRADSMRALAPLRPADDAAIVDTGDMTAEDVVDYLETYINNSAAAKDSATVKDSADANGGATAEDGATANGGATAGRDAARKESLPFRIALFVAVLWAKLFFRMRAVGLENIPKGGAGVVCANHTTGMDMVFIGACIKRRVRWIAKAELFSYPILGSFIKRLGAFPVRRGAHDRKAAREVYSLLASGDLVGIFPEGTRMRDSSKRPPANKGFYTFAKKAGVPIFPISLRYEPGPFGAYRVFSRVTVAFCEPVWPKSGAVSDREHDASEAKSIVDGIYARTQTRTQYEPNIKTALKKAPRRDDQL